MLQYGLLVALGFFVATLLALMLAPILWRRAVRLTTRRIQGTIPLSMSDIQADKDQLRAEFAMSTRKLEMNVEGLKHRTSSQVMDISKQVAKVKALSIELQEQKDIVAEHEATIASVKERLLRSEDEAKGYLQSYKDATVKLTQQREQYDQKLNVLNAVSMKADERKVEIAALKTQLAGREQELLTLKTQQESKLAKLDTDRETLARGIKDVQANSADQLKELEVLRARDDEQKAQIKLQEDRIATAENACDKAQEENKTLRADLNKMSEQAENGWEKERMENAMLRERLNDVAAEVARMTAALEGDDGEIEAILSKIDAPDLSANGSGPEQDNGTNGMSANGQSKPEPSSLAARIRALQSQASRI